MDKFWWVLSVVCLDFITFFIDHWTDIIVNTIGGAIGGFIVYRYVMRKENAREARIQQWEQNKDYQEKKEKCTSALLSTQMSILLQLRASKSLEALIHEILYFSLNETKLEELFKDINSRAEIAIFLRTLVINSPLLLSEKLMCLTNYIDVFPIENNIITLPYELFETLNVPLNKKFSEAVLAQYFQELAICNEKYNSLIGGAMHANKMRDAIMNVNLISKIKIDSRIETLGAEERDAFLGIIAGIFVSARSLKKSISGHLKAADQAFLKAAEYIELLGISKPIPIVRNEDGNPSFNKISEKKTVNEYA